MESLRHIFLARRFRPQCDEALPRRDRSGDFPRANALRLRFETHNHCAGAASRASANHNEFRLRFRGQRPQRILPPIPQDQGDRFPQTLEAFFMRSALAIRAGNFGAPGDIPWAVLLNNRRELVAHILDDTALKRTLKARLTDDNASGCSVADLSRAAKILNCPHRQYLQTSLFPDLRNPSLHILLHPQHLRPLPRKPLTGPLPRSINPHLAAVIHKTAGMVE